MAPNFSGAEASTNTTSLIFSNAVQTAVNLGTSTRRGVSNITFVGPNVGAFNFTNTGRWVLSYGGKISMDTNVTNSIQLGRIGFGTNSVVGGSYTLENNASLATATMLSSVSFTTANSNNTSTMILTGANTGANRFDSASGNLAIIKNGTGRWDLSGSTFTGNSTINSGTIGLAGNNALGTGVITINGGTIGSVTSGRSLGNNIVVGGDFQLGGLGQSTTLSGNVDLGGATRTITMGNSATISGTLSNGNLTIKDGTLNLSTTGLIHSNTAFSLVGTNSAAALSISGLTAAGLTVNNFSATTNTTITLGSKSLTMGGDGSSTTNRAMVTGTGSLVKEGAGTMTLGSSSSTFSGGTQLNGGGIAIASDNAFGTGLVTVAGGTQLGSYSTQARTISNNLVINGNFTLGGFGNKTTLTGNLDLGGATRALTLGNSAVVGGVISNGGLSLSSDNASTGFTLTNAATYTGGTTVNGGSLLLSGDGLLHSNSAVSLQGSSVASSLDVSGIGNPGLTVNSLNATTNTTIALGGKTLTTGGDGSSTTNRAAITGTGGLVKEGSGTMTLGSSDSTFSGGVQLNGGSIAIASDSAFGSGLLSIAGGTRLGSYATQARTIANNLAVNGDFTLGGFNRSTTLTGAMDLGGSTRAITLENSALISGSISNGGLTVNSSAGRTLTLSGDNTYTGATTVNGGTLLVNNTSGSGTGTGGVSVASGAILGGSGTLAGATAVSGTLSPGNSPGVLTFGSDLTLNTGGNMVWELYANADTNSPLVFDQVVVGGNLAVLGSFGLTLNFGTTGLSTVDWTNSFWDTEKSWTIFSVTGSASGTSNLSLLNSVYTDAAGNSLVDTAGRTGASFKLDQVGNNVVLNYIPEPSTPALFVTGLLGLAALRAIRRKTG